MIVKTEHEGESIWALKLPGGFYVVETVIGKERRFCPATGQEAKITAYKRVDLKPCLLTFETRERAEGAVKALNEATK